MIFIRGNIQILYYRCNSIKRGNSSEHVNTTDIFPLITEHKGKELAYRCLISLGFFNSALESRCKRRGSPSPSFYREIGIKTFNELKMVEISKHFLNWESFI